LLTALKQLSLHDDSRFEFQGQNDILYVKYIYFSTLPFFRLQFTTSKLFLKTFVCKSIVVFFKQAYIFIRNFHKCEIPLRSILKMALR